MTGILISMLLTRKKVFSEIIKKLGFNCIFFIIYYNILLEENIKEQFVSASNDNINCKESKISSNANLIVRTENSLVIEDKIIQTLCMIAKEIITSNIAMRPTFHSVLYTLKFIFGDSICNQKSFKVIFCFKNIFKLFLFFRIRKKEL